MTTEIKVGACIGTNQLESYVKYGLGNYVYLSLPGVRYVQADGPEVKETEEQLNEHRQEAIRAAEFCRKNKIFFEIEEVRNRRRLVAYMPYRREDFQAIAKAGGKYFLGRFTVGESGGTVYWPKEYLKDSPLGVDMNLPDAKDMAEAKKFYVDRIRKAIGMEEKLTGRPWSLVCSSILHKYHLEAGIEIPVLEVFPGPCDFLYSATRGAMRGYGKKRWGSHIAMTWYGGCEMDALWFKRWKTSLYTSYIAGAESIYSEHGHLGNYSLTNKASADSREAKQYRKILKDFYTFCKKNPRPRNGPKVKVGIVHGNLDGHGGLWAKWVWGQYKGDHWKSGDAENGWNLYPEFYRKTDWYTPTLTGEQDTTGNPPCGQIDIVPIESSQEILNQYSCLMFLGWNTCTDEIYKKLKKYVYQGGHLWISVPQLSTETDRRKDWKLIYGGKWQDLFGVNIKGKGKVFHAGVKFLNKSRLPEYSFATWGKKCDPKFIGNDLSLANVELKTGKVLAVTSSTFNLFDKEKEGDPILIENQYGKGTTFLLTTWTYPGHSELTLFMKDIVRSIVQAEQDKIRVVTSDRIRYGYYEEKGKSKIYFFNTDFDNAHKVKIFLRNILADEITVESNNIYVYPIK
jgi:hypothetical protein